MKSHTIITGTGRAGTTFLVELLTHLGLDTGFNSDNLSQYKSNIAHAGLEHPYPFTETTPRIVKSPWYCDYIEQMISDGVKLDTIIIPVRDISAAAMSRIYVYRRSNKVPHAPGALWHTRVPENQEAVLCKQISKLLLGVAKSQADVILLAYPKMMYHPEYLYVKLNKVISGIHYDIFSEVFNNVIDTTLVHQYNENDC